MEIKENFEQATASMLLEIAKNPEVEISNFYDEKGSRGFKCKKGDEDIFSILGYRHPDRVNYILIIDGHVMQWDKNLLKSIYSDLLDMYNKQETEVKKDKEIEKRAKITDFLSKFVNR